MKDLDDVIGYLANILGSEHELTNVVKAAKKNSVKKKYSDAEEVVMWSLCSMIFGIKPLGNIKWDYTTLQNQCKTDLDEKNIMKSVDEMDLFRGEEDYNKIKREVYNVIDDDDNFFNLVVKIEHDFAGEVLEDISKK